MGTTVHKGSPQGPGDTGSPGSGVKGGCELPAVGTSN